MSHSHIIAVPSTRPDRQRSWIKPARCSAFVYWWHVAVLLVLTLAGCQRREILDDVPAVATTTSYLEAAVRDLMPEGVRVVRLAEPGTCPGHFDIRASQVAEIRRCRVLFRFDFQQALDAKLVGDKISAPRIVAIRIPGGMGEPDSYRSACHQVAEALIRSGLLSRDQATAHRHSIDARLDALSREVRRRIAEAGLVGMPVVASRHQQAFCAWLGFRVVATFGAADTAGVQEIERALAAGRASGVKLVVANRPEGRRAADALAGGLGAYVVVLENFPSMQGSGPAFDAMVRANVHALLEATRS